MTVSLSGYRTKTHLVYEALRQTILAGRYQPGSRINIDELAVEFGTSKVPIREAIGRLVGEGLLQTSPHVGAMIPELSVEEIIETSIMRSVVEGAAVRFSADLLSDAAFHKLRSLLARMDDMDKARPATCMTQYPQLNFEFHSTAYEACPFASLKATATSLLERTRRLGTVRFLPQYLPTARAQHWKIFRALELRDGKAAERITRHHVEQSGRLLSQFAQTTVKPSAKK